MKPFDLEAAKRGEPIVALCDGSKPFFVGVDSEGFIVIETDSGHLCRCMPNEIFMAPKKRTVWVNFYDWTNANYFDSETEANDESACGRIGGKAYPVEIEE